MPTIEATTNVREIRTCPLCDAPLDSANPNECPKCDWVLGYRRRQNLLSGSQRDRISVIMSLIPGLGHIYKGHNLAGVIFMVGAVLAVLAAGLAATASAGWGMLLLPFYWVAVMMHVFWLEDRKALALASS